MRRSKLLASLVLVFVVILLTAPVYADPTDRFDRPIPMGVSIGNTPSLPFIYAGTAGMRVFPFSNPNIKLILSNNHVLGARGPSLCPNTATFGTWTLQPGTLDIGADPGNDPFYVAGIVVKFIPIDFSPGASNLVDAAVAYTTPAFAGTTILGLGEPNQALGFAQAGMAVSKSGRTTGVTTGTVESINLTVFVSYGDCGTARFVNQFSITPGTFSTSGDSGSVILETDTNTPVGLLFAGSATSTVANHIYFVYLSLGVFVDGTAPTVSTDQIRGQFEAMSKDPMMSRLQAIQAREEENILSIPGVVGMGIGLAENGDDLGFIVYLKELTQEERSLISTQLEGVPVRIIESGEFRAY